MSSLNFFTMSSTKFDFKGFCYDVTGRLQQSHVLETILWFPVFNQVSLTASDEKNFGKIFNDLLEIILNRKNKKYNAK